MTPTPKRAEPLPPADDAAEHLDLLSNSVDFVEPSFDQEQWAGTNRPKSAARAAGRCSAAALAVLAALWLAYAGLVGRPDAWRSAADLAAIAQWIAVAAGPLALSGLPG